MKNQKKRFEGGGGWVGVGGVGGSDYGLGCWVGGLGIARFRVGG